MADKVAKQAMMAEGCARDAMGQDDISSNVRDEGDECRRLREQIEVMAQEMRHRLRNAYAVSAAIASASGREEPKHRDFAESLAQRFNSLSLAQSLLLDGGVRHSLHELVERIGATLGPHRRCLQAGDLPDGELSDQQVRLAALVLGELATNSIKYGALQRDLPVALEAAERDGGLVVTWTEELDPAAISNKGQDGTGYPLMRRMARAHGGSFAAEWAPERLVARLTIPGLNGDAT